MIQNPVVPHNTSSTTFPLVSAEACTCCGRALSQGYDVPYVGVVGPKCVRKYAALAAALARLDTLTITETDPMDARLAVNNLVLVLRTRIGYAVELIDNADGSKSIRVGARTREYTKVCKTWRERRAEFELELQLAEAYLAAQVAPAPAAAPVLTVEALAAMTAPQRRAVAAEHGVLTVSGKPSTSVALIWTAVQVAQAAEAQAVAVSAPALACPVIGLLALPHLTMGRTAQPEQRHFAQAVPDVLDDAHRPPAWATPENCERDRVRLHWAQAVLPTASPRIYQLGLCSPLLGLRVDGQDYRVTKTCIGHEVRSPTTLLTVEGFQASVDRDDMGALAFLVAQELERVALPPTLAELEAEADAAWADFQSAKGVESEDLCESLYGLWREASDRVQAARFAGARQQPEQQHAQRALECNPHFLPNGEDAEALYRLRASPAAAILRQSRDAATGAQTGTPDLRRDCEMIFAGAWYALGGSLRRAPGYAAQFVARELDL